MVLNSLLQTPCVVLRGAVVSLVSKHYTYNIWDHFGGLYLGTAIGHLSSKWLAVSLPWPVLVFICRPAGGQWQLEDLAPVCALLWLQLVAAWDWQSHPQDRSL